jgi:hypothetical protein
MIDELIDVLRAVLFGETAAEADTPIDALSSGTVAASGMVVP